MNNSLYATRPSEGLSFWLDVTRASAALLVLLAHSRLHIIGLWADDPSGLPPVVMKAFYAATGMGHEAVVLFFVMSGYLVGRKALAQPLYERHAFTQYAIDRLTRIWIVLIPAVLLSVIAAYVLSYTVGASYSGATPTCLPSLQATLATLTFLNEGYMDTVCSNLPAWSIHSEVHYYLLWPMLIFALTASNAGPVRVINGTLFAAIVLALVAFDTLDIKHTLILAPVWVAGVYIDRLWVPAIPLWIIGAALAVTMIAPSIDMWAGLWPLSDYLIAVLALAFYARARHTSWRPMQMARLFGWLARISFSIYLTHIIVITGARSLLEYGAGMEFPRTDLAADALPLFVGVVVASVLFGHLFSALFESKTPQLRILLMRLVRKSEQARP